MFGNMWSAYQDGKEFCGLKNRGELSAGTKLETPILTPSTKTSEGHDTYVPFDYVITHLAVKLPEKSIIFCQKLYDVCYKYAYGERDHYCGYKVRIRAG